jgi:hypothetical protein
MNRKREDLHISHIQIENRMEFVLLAFLYLLVSITLQDRYTNLPLSGLLFDLDVSLGLTGLAVHPESDETEPSCNGNPDTTDPGVSARDDITPGVLVVRKVADGDSALLLNVGEEGTTVFDEEVVDTVLVR